MDPIQESFHAYKQSPSPDGLAKVVKHLQPTIDYSLGYLNAQNDPVLRSKAMLFAADAVDKYDPQHGASLPTWVSSQLQQLGREARKLRSPVSVPERIQLDSLKMHQAKKRYADEHGREPDIGELADYTSMPVKRLEKVQRYQFSMPTEAAMGEIEGEGPDLEKEALEYVYHEADHTDRRILEMKTGYGGHPVMAPKDIAVHLKLTPTQLTRRSMRITKKLNDLREALQDIT
jgi:DNA-directed RNA polymerase specialized sigma subunit